MQRKLRKHSENVADGRIKIVQQALIRIKIISTKVGISMIKHSTHHFVNLQLLKEHLVANEIQTWGTQARSVLVQIFTARFDKSLLSEITSMIETFLPKAVIVGATTVGEIANGYTFTGETIIGFDFFPTSLLSPLVLDCPMYDEYDIGVALGKKIASNEKVAGVLLLAHPKRQPFLLKCARVSISD